MAIYGKVDGLIARGFTVTAIEIYPCDGWLLVHLGATGRAQGDSLRIDDTRFCVSPYANITTPESMLERGNR